MFTSFELLCFLENSESVAVIALAKAAQFALPPEYSS